MSNKPDYLEMAHTLERLPVLLKGTRSDRDMTQRQVADAIGISHSALSQIEKGKGTTTDTAKRVLRWLHASQNVGRIPYP